MKKKWSFYAPWLCFVAIVVGIYLWGGKSIINSMSSADTSCDMQNTAPADDTANTSEETSQQTTVIVTVPTTSTDRSANDDNLGASAFDDDNLGSSFEDDNQSSSFSNSSVSSYRASYDLPPEYYEEQALADLAIDQYLSGKWDGNPITMEGHVISISFRGYLLMDGYITSPSEIHSQHCLDFPKDMHRHDYIYIPNEGTYLIENNRLVHYQRQEKVSMSGGPLNWSGMDTENYRPYDVYFYYDEPHDTLFLIASSVPYDYSSDELKYNVGIYLYTIPDRTKSEIKFVDEIINLSMDEYGLFYLDTNDTVWRYTEKLCFKRSFDTNLKNKFPENGVAEGEIEWDWFCSFADGFIGSRDAFPEGTFTHPVVTTPREYLSNFEWDYKYKNIYSY